MSPSESSAVTTKLGYPVFDIDNHYYEPANCFVDWVEPRYRDRAVRLEVQPDGTRQIFFGDAPLVNDGTNFVDDQCVKPGALRELLRSQQGGLPSDAAREPTRREYLEREPRLELMNEQGLESACLFPSLGVMLEYWMQHDVELAYACFDGFNRYLDETWGFDYQGRIYTAPVISLLDLDRAVAQLEEVIRRGARVIALTAGPAFGRSPADPYFDPFWARVNEAKLAVAYHIGEPGYVHRYADDWGEDPNPRSYSRSALQWSIFMGDRPLMDTMMALIYHNLFGRFPNVKVLSVENGSIWVAYLLKVMDKMKGMARGGPWPGGYLKGKPSDVFKEHVWVAPYHEEDVNGLVDLLGPEHVLFGSDFLHAEGLANPVDFVDSISGRSEEEIRLIMRENARRLIRAD
jgi:predicted TIM-barrel fold metal-dependent hydrolase